MSETPRQRTRFRRRRDYLVALGLALAVVVTWALIWQGSDVHNTASHTTDRTAKPLASPATPPPSLAEAWRQPNGASPEPITVGSIVATGDGGSVIGRDPVTGAQRWSYQRDLPLCTLGKQWGRVLALFGKNGWCGQITSLYADTGKRGPQRNGDSQEGTRAIGDGEHVTTTGSAVLDTFDSSLVRTVIYGNQPDYKNGGHQPRIGCSFGSAATASDQIGVIEHCGPSSSQPDAGHDRFTAYNVSHKGKDDDEPNVASSVQLPGKDARLVTMNARYAAIAMPNPARLLVLDTTNGAITAQYPIAVPTDKLTAKVPGHSVPVSTGPSSTYWYTGAGVLALDKYTFRPQWTLDGALGPGTQFAGRTLIPVPSGIQILDSFSGRKLGEYALDRRGYQGQITMSALGPVVFEQRGRTLVALR